MKRICVECHAHMSVEDGNRCSDCLNAYLRATRPTFEPEWLRRRRTTPNGLAKDLTGTAA